MTIIVIFFKCIIRNFKYRRFFIQKGSKVLQPMIVEKVAPVVVHLADVAVVNTPSESNIKVALDEKTLPLADPIHKVPVSTFQKTADVSVDKSEKADKIVNVLDPQSKKRKKF